MTNFEKLKNEMTVQKMAEYINAGKSCSECPGSAKCGDMLDATCLQTITDWLEKEAE
jgi:hypothetical protein